jgi:DNA-directed RNA polymerase specialized sigma24 family protein
VIGLASDSAELLALKTLHEERLPVFARTARAITRDPDAARDVVQEASQSPFAGGDHSEALRGSRLGSGESSCG